MNPRLNDISFRELSFLSLLPRFDTLRGLAHALHTSPISVSRTLKSIESKLDTLVVQRTNSGISLTEKGLRLASAAHEMLNATRELDDALSSDASQNYVETRVIASRGFLGTYLAPPIIKSLAQRTQLGLRFLDLSPDETREAAKAGYADVAITFEALELGSHWLSALIGQVSWKIFARARHPLSKGGDLEDLKRYRLSHHAFWNGMNIVSNEGVEHPELKIRQSGFGSETAATAMSSAQCTDQLICIPEFVAFDAVALGRLIELTIDGFHPDYRDVYLSIHSERISQPEFKTIFRAVQSALNGT